MNRTSIEWTHRPETAGPRGGFTWNPIRARLIGASPKTHSGTFCTRISPGCKNCYASVINKRFGTGAEYSVPELANHEFYIDVRILAEPLNRKKPATIFVGDMFDLFHEAIPSEMIAEVLRIAIKTPWHTFQFLTKRAERMQKLVTAAQEHWERKFESHMWFGVSVEDQPRVDERIPLLLQTPAALKFLSVEPQLGDVFLQAHLLGTNRIDWVICGGESGPGARPFDLAWAEALLMQCKAAGVPFFMKQIGSKPIASGALHGFATTVFPETFLRNRKGGDPAEWPERLRVREFPR